MQATIDTRPFKKWAMRKLGAGSLLQLILSLPDEERADEFAARVADLLILAEVDG